MLDAQGLVKKFGAVTAVDGLSLRVEAGEVVGLLGPNGAGKTTTLRMLAGILTPTSGEVRVNGYDMRTEALRAKQSIGSPCGNGPTSPAPFCMSPRRRCR